MKLMLSKYHLRRMTMSAALGVGMLCALGLFYVTPVCAMDPITGELGVDLENFSYQGYFKGRIITQPILSYVPPSRLESNRTLSNHFLRLGMSGSVVNSNFANYSLRAKLFGTYSSTKYTSFVRNTSQERDIDSYESPSIGAYSAQLTFFPERRYPIKLMHSKSHDFSLRYEPSNRSDIELILPQLAVVRRYEGKTTTNGAQFQYSMNERLSLTSEVKSDERETLRNYDFSEDRNLWVVVTTIRPDSLQVSDEVVITNTRDDADLIIVIDSRIVDTAFASQEITITVDSGSHRVDIIPTQYYNQYSFNIDVRGDMAWNVVYNPPATPNDQKQSTKSVNANLEYDGAGAFTNRTFFEFSDQDESFQNLISKLTVVSNTARLQLRDNLDATILSSLNKSETELVDISHQSTSAALNTTSLSWTPKRNIISDFSHSFNRNSSETEVGASMSDVTSKMHTLNTRTRISHKRLKHVLTLKGDYTRLRDSKDYGTNQQGINVINEFKVKVKGISLEPRQDLKYTTSTVHEPVTDDSGRTIAIVSSTTKEIEPKFSLLGEVPPNPTFGDIRFKLQYDYRDRYDDIASNTTSKYYADVSVVRKFNKVLRILVSTSREIEKYGSTEIVTLAGRTDNSRPDEKQSTYRIDTDFTPREDISIGVGALLIKQDGNTISKFSLMISATLPILKLPARTFILSEKRDISGIDPQITTTAETKVSYRIRQITLVFSHNYTKEQLVNETFSLHEAKAQIKRNFSLFE